MANIERVVRCVVTIGVVAASAGSAAAQVQRDTLPEHVVQRMYEGFKRHDLDATYADYDSVFTYERFGDPAGAQQLRRDENLRRMKADTALLRIIRRQRVSLVRSDVYGAFVVQEWRERFGDGRDFKHFELVEVRGVKIVREMEGDRLLNGRGGTARTERRELPNGAISQTARTPKLRRVSLVTIVD